MLADEHDLGGPGTDGFVNLMRPRPGGATPNRHSHRRLVSLVLAGPGPMIWGGELVLRDGVAVGQVTSGAWGEAVGGCMGLAYIRHPGGCVLTPGTARAGSYQVNVGGRLYEAAVHLRPPFDPAATGSTAATSRRQRASA